jgi:tetratricopeptide (TPR) repeat protein
MSTHAHLASAQQALAQGDPDAASKEMGALACQVGRPLDTEEESLLFATFKAAASKRRQDLQRYSGNTQARAELGACCADAIKALEISLLNAQEIASKVFLSKALGDFHRYVDEAHTGEQYKEAALHHYRTAMSLAAGPRGLSPINSLRLNVALNYGVLFDETMGDKERGLEITEEAIEAARAAWKQATDETERKQAAFVLGMLFENANLWSKELHRPQPKPFEGLNIKSEGEHHTHAPSQRPVQQSWDSHSNPQVHA